MRIMDGLKLKGAPAIIPDCSRDDLPQFFTEMGYKTGAEIGVEKGVFSEKLARAGLQVYAIDSWKNYPGYMWPKSQEVLDSFYEQTKKVLAPFPECKVIKKTSMEAVGDFNDESLDFVYIDANHTFRYVAEDIYEWSKKVKKGGIVSGHDFDSFKPNSLPGVCAVIQVVNAYTQAYKIDNWFALGREKAVDKEKRDEFRSWMFFKQ